MMLSVPGLHTSPYPRPGTAGSEGVQVLHVGEGDGRRTPTILCQSMLDGPEGDGRPTSTLCHSVLDRPETSTSLDSGKQEAARVTRQQGQNRAQALAQADGDEETLRMHIYWQKWGNKAAMELLQRHYEEEAEAAKPQLVFSGHVGSSPGHVRCKPRPPSPEGSEATELSLLTCGSAAREEGSSRSGTRRRRRKKKQADAVQEKPDWEKLARERRTGVLANMMKRDTAALDMMAGHTARPQLAELMTQEERDLLMRSSFTRGLVGREKSHSTANILFIPPKQRQHGEIRQGSAGSGTSATSRRVSVNGLRPSSRPDTSGSRPLTSGSGRRSYPPPTGRTPSPAVVKRSITPRPSSCHPGLMRVDGAITTPSGRCATAGHVTSRQPQHTLVAGDQDPNHVRTVKHRMARTVAALHRVTGWGDDACHLVNVHGEQGLYTASDYARHPRYPQNIRVAPHLSRVIASDVVHRMGRPRYHELRSGDVKQKDSEGSGLGRTHRNMLIFDWLGELPDDYSDDNDGQSEQEEDNSAGL